jgi:restriction system protein
VGVNISKNSDIQTYTNKNGIKKYKIAIWHDDLGKHQIIRTDNLDALSEEARLKMEKWDELWRINQSEDRERLEFLNKINHTNKKIIQYEDPKDQDIWGTLKERLGQKHNIDSTIDREYIKTVKKTEQESLTPQELRVSMDRILDQAIETDNIIVWEELKNNKHFLEPEPIKVYPSKPNLQTIPNVPNKSDDKYNPKFNFFDKFNKRRQESMKIKGNNLFEEDMSKWEETKNKKVQNNQRIMDEYQKKLFKYDEKYSNLLNKWKQEKEEFINNKNEFNRKIETKEKMYLNCLQQGIIDYCELVLSNSTYPAEFPKEFTLEYKPESKIMVIDYQLPSLEVIPTLKEVKYIKSRDEYTEKHLPQTQINSLYDNVLYQIALRTIYELYGADEVNALDSINFNGYVKSIDRAIGREVNACILSVHAKKEDFKEINLAMVEPKACFKKLKGVGSSQLHSLTPIAPIIRMEREDKTFHRFLFSCG